MSSTFPGNLPCSPASSAAKITTYRKLAEHAMEKLRPVFPMMQGSWTADASLPGGDMPGADYDRFLGELRRSLPWLPEALLDHYARHYGTRTWHVLNGARDLAGLGRHFGGLLYETEISHLRNAEWARTAEDVLDRRAKHGLHLTPAERAGVVAYMGG